MAAMFLALPLALTSCGGDDDDDTTSGGTTGGGGSSTTIDYTLPASGTLTFTASDGTTYTREVSDAGFKIWSTDSYDTPTLDVYVEIDGLGRFYAVKYYLEKLEKDMAIYPNNNMNYTGSKMIDYSGTLSVTSWEASRYIYVKFENCSYTNGSNKKVTFSGVVRCPIRNRII